MGRHSSGRRRPIGVLDALALAETQAFVRRRLGPGPRSVVEVGCGDGDLAAALIDEGHSVLPLDADEAAVGRARAAGVPAVVARWPEFEHDAVEAILFTRSLHHLEPLDAALDRAIELLAPGGQLVVEDFAYEEADPATLEWLRRALVTLDEARLLRADDDSFVRRFLAAGGTVEAWRAEHPHHLHPAATMAREVAARVDAFAEEPAPYLFRYLIAGLEPTRNGFTALRMFLVAECEAIERGAVTPIGRRFAGLRPR